MRKKRDVIDYFNNLDLTFENLKKNYTQGFSQKELEDLFEQNDKDQDGRLSIEDYIRILLPPDYVIEDGDDQQ